MSTDDHAFSASPRGLSTLFYRDVGAVQLTTGSPRSSSVHDRGRRRGRRGEDSNGAAIYGTYTSMVYLVSCRRVIADRSSDTARRLVWRHPDRVRPLLVAVPAIRIFLLRLVLIIVRTGPHRTSARLSKAVRSRRVRRDAGFSLLHGTISARLSGTHHGLSRAGRRVPEVATVWASTQFRMALGVWRGRLGMILASSSTCWDRACLAPRQRRHTGRQPRGVFEAEARAILTAVVARPRWRRSRTPSRRACCDHARRSEQRVRLRPPRRHGDLLGWLFLGTSGRRPTPAALR